MEVTQEVARSQLLAKSKNEWLTPDELYEEYKFSKSSQAKMRMKRLIPYVKVGRYIRYRRATINKWLEANRVA